METKTTLLFGIHMHQPVDNFGWVIERAIEECYEPFFDVMDRYKNFRFSVHCSGWLLEQIYALRPELFERMRRMTHDGVIEWFGAGYYEPILSSIASADRVDQIDRLSEALENHFGTRPQGMWLTERVWESSIVPDVCRSGIRYTVMDDYHFLCAGFDGAALDGYYMTEEGGEALGLFPISKKLRYALPFLSVDKAIQAIKTYNRESDSAAIVFDDAEKFGMWPGTHEWVYDKGWLERFVEAVIADPMIETMTFGDYFDSYRPRGSAYLPTASYYEMGEWSLRPDDAIAFERLRGEMDEDRFEREGVKFLKGGIWKNFLVKYTESNRIHKRMVELSKLRSTLNDPVFDTALFKLQTNDVLWHGVFGGLYLPNLRDNAYGYLIECENRRYGSASIMETEAGVMDGHPKFKAVTEALIWRFDAGCGGQLVECDLRDKEFNYQNTLTRRREAYHDRLFEPRDPAASAAAPEDGIDTIHNASLSVDESLRRKRVVDWYLKHSFIDHISDAMFDLEHFFNCNFREYSDFANQPFVMETDNDSVIFSRDGGLFVPEKIPARLIKRFTPRAHGIEFTIRFHADTSMPYRYVMEHNFHFAEYSSVTINSQPLGESGTIEHCKDLSLRDGYLNKRIDFHLDQECSVHYFLLETLSQSEKGVDVTVQGISLAFVFMGEGECEVSGSLEIVDDV